jgi:hypothetical protein
MAKRVYEIQEYVVNINGNDETRKVAIYYDTLGAEVTRVFYVDGDELISGYVEKSSVISQQQDEE